MIPANGGRSKRLVHPVADKIHAFPKESDVQRYLSRTVRFPRLPHPLANKHERHAAAVVSFHAVEHAADAMEETGQENVIRDDGGDVCGKVFFRHLCAPFGRWIGPTGCTLARTPEGLFCSF